MFALFHNCYHLIRYRNVFKTPNLYYKHLSVYNQLKFLFDIICLICLHREVSNMGLRFLENLLISYNYVVASHDRWPYF